MLHTAFVGKITNAAELNSGLREACNKKCTSTQSTDICFVSKKIADQQYSKKIGSCGDIKNVEIVTDAKQIVSALRKIVDGCGRVSKIVFAAHGDQVGMSLGGRFMAGDNESWNRLDSDLSCSTTNDAIIDMRTCNIGKGCDGQRQMYEISKAFFGEKRGTVLAPATYLAADNFGMGRGFSINGKYRTLSYLGSDREPIFGYEGLLLSTPDAHAVCMEEVESLKARLKHLQRLLKKNSCDSVLSSSQIVIHDLETLMRDPTAKMSPKNISITKMKKDLDENASVELSRCIKARYRKKLSDSPLQADIEYLRALEADDWKSGNAILDYENEMLNFGNGKSKTPRGQPVTK